MIVFDLRCADGHRFEGWFGSSGDYASQRERGLLSCPRCGITAVEKAPMAPAVPAKGNRRSEGGGGGELTNTPLPPEVVSAMRALAAAQARALESSRWVGESFAEETRAMHYGEKELEAVHGKATLAEAKALLEEGIAVAPLPFPVPDAGTLN